jgi:xyloglucan-specific exo-beta-1,4-glucanase
MSRTVRTHASRKTLLLVAALAAAALTAGSLPGVSRAQTTQYTWRNVAVVGGGFVPGIIFNQTEPNLVYARTDIGGAYRLDPATNRWVPLTDSISWDDWNLTGIVSIATDPVNTSNVYLAAGTYTNEWTSQNGAILRSSDKGATWQRTMLPFKLGGNMPGRGAGERLAVDPNKNSILFLGAPSGNGLWKSADSGVTWSKVTSFPDPGTYVQDPTDPNHYLTDNQGVYWVTFDKRSGTAGNATQTVYVGVADNTGPSVYRTTDGGTTWSAVPGQPVGFLPHKGVLDTSGGFLYVAYSDKGGPYDGASGDVWKYNTATGAWTLISPIPSTNTNDDYFGYSGLSVDRQHPNTIMVTGYSSWWPDTQIWRSTNGGASWSRIWDWTRYPSRSFRYTQDITAAPWLKSPPAPVCGGGRPGAEVNPKLGWMTEALEIDPFNPDRFMYGTGATLYGSTNLTTWDLSTTSQITIKVMAQGIEETAVQDLVSPPSGAPLLSALGDIGGFRHNDVTIVPSAQFATPRGTNTSIDYAELSPAYVVRVGNGDTANCEKSLAISTDGGTTWAAVSAQPSGLTGGGTVAVSATGGGKIVWSPAGVGVYYTTGGGKTWTASVGIPAGARVAADRVNANKFYGFKSGTFYVSTDGGKTFAATLATGLPQNSSVHFKAVPGREGDIWLAGGSETDNAYGLWHSTDSGASFVKLANVEEADNVGFGKAATGQTYMALYIPAQIGGVRGLYRSTDAGVTWVRINDDQHQWGRAGESAITGDPRIYGRVYVGTNGRGIIYGDGQ